MNKERIIFLVFSAFCFVVGLVNWSFLMFGLSLGALVFGIRSDFWIKAKSMLVGVRSQFVLLFDWLIALLLAFILVSNVSSLFFDFYTIPSSSMEPNLRIGDMVIVNKTILGNRLFENRVSTSFRVGGFGNLKRGDIIVFNYPEGDSCLSDGKSSYLYDRRLAGASSSSLTKFSYVPVSRRERYLKRIIGMPTDTVSIRMGNVFTNHQHLLNEIRTLRTFVFDSITDASIISKFDSNKITYSSKKASIGLNYPYDFTQLGIDSTIVPYSIDGGIPDRLIFPFQISICHFNADNIGSIVVPKKGLAMDISSYTIPFYRRIIEVYEGNKLEEGQNGIFINGKRAITYTFKQNYYWVMGDNRGHSFDSRYWGFVPENHIIGVASHVLLSNDTKPDVEHQLRLNRFVMPLRN